MRVWCEVTAGEMCMAWRKELDFEMAIKHFGGKTFKLCDSGRLSSVLGVVLFLCCFAFCGFCDEAAMVSRPLGFEISGLDRSRSWVSQNGVFAFGFLEFYQKDEDVDGFVVGVRYNLGDKTANVPVWTVGGGLRVSANSTIRLSMDGRLILLENLSSFIVWSSNTSGLGVTKVSLLNNGNLVLMNEGNNVIWQSFDSPTSTLLPGQSLHFPQTLRAPSTKSVSSYYNFVVRHSGELALVWEGNVTYWRTGLSFSDRTKEVRFGANGLLEAIDMANKTVWSTSSQDFDDSSVSLRHLRMDSDGNLRIYSWDNVHHHWRVGWQAVENQCDVFGSCGLYSLCGFNSTGPFCDCLYQDSANWGMGFGTTDIGNSGCQKMVDLGNCKLNTSMMVLKKTVLYGLYPPQDVDMIMSEEACKELCSNDNNCVAATSKNDGSGICTIKRTSFISGYRNPSVPATSFLKVCLVPQAVAAHGADPHVNSKQVPTSPNGLMDLGGVGRFMGSIALVVFVTVSVFLAVQMFVFWFIYHRCQINAGTRIPFGKDAQMNAHYSALIRLSFEEIKELTINFSNQLGPSVYKGVLPNKMPVIAKMLNHTAPNEKDFRVAVSTLGGMHHRNLVPLKGFCFDANHRFLLYEYVPNGSLDKWLFNVEQEQSKGNWQLRLDIALGVARALAYLHSECQISVAHGNLKLEKVLLDEKLVPMLTEFGLKSLLLKEEASSSESPAERDIYMLGEMLLQIVACKRNILSNHLHHLLDQMPKGLDIGNADPEVVERVVRIAFWCMQTQPFLRPSIGEVVKVLEGTLSVDRPPMAFPFGQNQMDDIVLTENEVEPRS